MGNPFDQDGADASQVDQFEDKTPEEFVEELVGEGKKYSTVAEAVRALAHAQHHISTLESETQTLREKTTQAKTIDDVFNALQQRQNPAADKGDDNTQSQKPSDDKDNVDVEATVKRLLEQQLSSQTAESNRDKVITAMRKQFGGKAGEVWDKAERELGVNLDDMAATSPAATLKLLGVEAQQDSSQQRSFNGDFNGKRPNAGQRPPEGSKRLVDYMLKEGEITRKEAVSLKYKYSADPEKYRA